MSKFKVGDIIKPNTLANNVYTVTNEYANWIGEVTYVKGDVCNAKTIAVNHSIVGKEFYNLNEFCFDLVEGASESNTTNYIHQVAKTLGLEIGEEFRVHCDVEEVNIMVFKEDGLYYAKDNQKAYYTLGKIMHGEYPIEKLSWKPKFKEIYYYVGPSGHAFQVCFCDSTPHLNNYKLGNCYKTIDEAEADKDKWISFYKEVVDEICKN